MNFQIFLSVEARRDLSEIQEYLAGEFGAADRQIGRISERIDSLEIFPFRYPLCHELLWYDKKLRSVPVDRYHVFYLPDEEKSVVEVVRILHGSRDIQAIFLEDFLKV